MRWRLRDQAVPGWAGATYWTKSGAQDAADRLSRYISLHPGDNKGVPKPRFEVVKR